MREFKALLDMSVLGIPMKGMVTLYYDDLTDEQKRTVQDFIDHSQDGDRQLHLDVKGQTIYNSETMNVIGIEL